MAPEESPEEVSRIVLDVGREKITVTVYELFALAGTDFEGAARRELAANPVRLEPWTLKAPLRAFAYSPKNPKQSGQANLLMGLLVAQADGTVQDIAFYVNPAAAQSPTATRR